MLTSLALLPALVLLVYIYKKDKLEKEGIGILLGCLAFGVLSIIPILILETILEEVVLAVTYEGSYMYAVLDAFLVAAFSEELFKFIFLKLKTFKSKQFNCVFDGIVYAVFVSLGFAALENVMYVADGGISTAMLRMFTSVPGHTCFGVIMGYYYSQMKIAQVNGDKKAYRKSRRNTLFMPILAHGLYDMCLMVGEDEPFAWVFSLLWFVVLVVLFVRCFMLVNKVSKNDSYIVYESNTLSLGGIQNIGISRNIPQGYVCQADSLGQWQCICNSMNNGNFCPKCGRKRRV